MPGELATVGGSQHSPASHVSWNQDKERRAAQEEEEEETVRVLPGEKYRPLPARPPEDCNQSPWKQKSTFRHFRAAG